MTMKMLDEERLKEIAARAGAAASGPWRPMLEGRDHSSGSSCIVTSVVGIDLDGASDADIEFIANARQDVPYLIAELQRLAFQLVVDDVVAEIEEDFYRHEDQSNDG